MAGAVDLSGLARPAAGPAAATAGAAVIDVTEETFQAEVLDRSQTVPVVIDFWASWCGPCRQLSPILEKLAAEGAGSWVLAKIDVDANPRIAQAAAVQGIPAVKAVLGGQLMSEFTGALPESQVREWLDQILGFAAQNGLMGEGAEPGELEPEIPTEAVAADEALRAGDLDGAAAAYDALLARSPGDPAALLGKARVELFRRVQTVDEYAARQAATTAPDDVAAGALVADLDMLAGDVDAAFSRLIGLVRRTAGDERDAARTHLLRLFEVLTPDDPRLVSGRRDLASALY